MALPDELKIEGVETTGGALDFRLPSYDRNIEDAIYGPLKLPGDVGEDTVEFLKRSKRAERDAQRRKEIVDFNARETVWAKENPGKAEEIKRYAVAMPDMDIAFIQNNLDEVRREFNRRQYDWNKIAAYHDTVADMIGDPTLAHQVVDDAAVLTAAETYLRDEDGVDRGLTGSSLLAQARDVAKYKIPLIVRQSREMWDDLTRPPALSTVLDSDDAGLTDPVQRRLYNTVQDMYAGDQENRAKVAELEDLSNRRYWGDAPEGVWGKVVTAGRAALSFPFANWHWILGGEVAGAAAVGLRGASAAAGAARAGKTILGATEKVAMGEATKASTRFAGMTAFNMLQNAPGMYHEARSIRGPNGERLSASAAALFTLVGAPTIGYLQSIGLTKAVHGRIGMALEETLTKRLYSGLAQKTVARSIMEWTARTSVATVEGAVAFAAQSAAMTAFSQLEGAALGHEIDIEKIGDSFLDGFKQGLIDMSFLSGIGAWRRMLEYGGRSQAAVRGADRVYGLINEVAEAKHPETLKELARRVAKTPGAPKEFYYDIPAWDTEAARVGMTGRELAARVMKDGGRAYDDAREAKQRDLKIPLPYALEFMQSRNHSDFHLMEARFGPDEPSRSSLERHLQDLLEKAVKPAEEKKVEEFDPEEREIYEDFYRRTKSAVEFTSEAERADQKADAAARVVLSVVRSFQMTAKTGSLIGWYNDTFKRVPIYGTGMVARELTGFSDLRDEWEHPNVAPRERYQSLLRDTLTGLYNSNAVELLAQQVDPKRPMWAFFDVPHVSFVNNKLKGDYSRANQMIANAADALADATERDNVLGRAHNGFVARVSGAQEAQAILDRANASLPEPLRLSMSVGGDPTKAAETFTKERADLEAKGLRTKSGDTPKGFSTVDDVEADPIFDFASRATKGGEARYKAPLTKELFTKARALDSVAAAFYAVYRDPHSKLMSGRAWAWHLKNADAAWRFANSVADPAKRAEIKSKGAAYAFTLDVAGVGVHGKGRTPKLVAAGLAHHGGALADMITKRVADLLRVHLAPIERNALSVLARPNGRYGDEFSGLGSEREMPYKTLVSKLNTIAKVLEGTTIKLVDVATKQVIEKKGIHVALGVKSASEVAVDAPFTKGPDGRLGLWDEVEAMSSAAKEKRGDKAARYKAEDDSVTIRPATDEEVKQEIERLKVVKEKQAKRVQSRYLDRYGKFPDWAYEDRSAGVNAVRSNEAVLATVDKKTGEIPLDYPDPEVEFLGLPEYDPNIDAMGGKALTETRMVPGTAQGEPKSPDHLGLVQYNLNLKNVTAQKWAELKSGIFLQPHTAPDTLLHEITHVIEGEILRLSTVHPEFKPMADTILREAGYPPEVVDFETWWKDKGSVKSKAAAERFVSMFLSYLKGEPPINKKLAPAFAQVALELARTDYNRKWGAVLNEGETALEVTEPTAKMRDLFNTLLTAADEVKATTEVAEVWEVFEQIRAKLSPEEQAQFDADARWAELSALERAKEVILNYKRAASQKWLKGERERITRAVRREFEVDPTYLGMEYLRTGKIHENGPQLLSAFLTAPDGAPLKLLRAEVESLPGGKGIVANIEKVAGKGAFTEDIAHSIDLNTFTKVFNRGREDVGAEVYFGKLAKAPRMEKAIQAEAYDRFMDQYKSIFLDKPQELRTEIFDAVVTNKLFKHVVKQMSAMARDIDPELAKKMAAVSPAELDVVAAKIVAETTIGDLHPDTLMRGIVAHMRESRDAAKEQRTRAAWDRAEAALTQVSVYKIARKTMDEVNKLYNRLDEHATGKAWRGRIGIADPKFRDMHDAILQSLGILKVKDGAPRIDGMVAFNDFMLAIKERGLEDAITDWDMNTVLSVVGGQREWKTLKPAEASNVARAIINISHLASEVNEIGAEMRRESLDHVMKSLLAEWSSRLPFLGKAPVSRSAKPISMEGVQQRGETSLTIEALLSSSKRPETIIDKLGPYTKRVVWEPYLEARNAKAALQTKIRDQATALWGKVPAEQQMKLRDPLPELARMLPIPDDINLAGAPDRAWLIMVMLNMGNLGNRQRLLGGFGWTPEQVTKAAERYLSPEIMDYVQGIWNMMNTEIFPLANAKEERRTGLPLEKVEATSFTLKFGGKEFEYKGGYFPARYDRRAGSRGIDADIAASEGDTYVKMNPNTKKSYTNRRVDHFVDVVDLDFNVLSTHMSEVIHDIAFDQYVRDMNKIFFNRKHGAKDVLYQRLGEEESKQIRAFLEVVAKDQEGSIPAHLSRVYKKLLRGGTERMIVGFLGHNVRNAMADLLHPFVMAAFGKVSAQDVTAVLPAMAGIKYKSMREYALKHSKELTNRTGSQTMSMRETLLAPKSVGKGRASKTLEMVQESSFVLLEKTDRIVSTMLWTAKMRELTRNGVEFNEAVRQADEVVRTSMPTHVLAELPALLRNQNTIGVLLHFLGYHNTLYNSAITKYQDLRMEWEDAPTPGAKVGVAFDIAATTGRIMAGLAVAYAMGDYLMGRGKERDEEWSQWWARKVLASPGNLIPFGSDISQAVVDLAVTGKVRQPNPLRAPAYAFFSQAWMTLRKMGSNSRKDEQKLWDLIELSLFALRLPSRQWRLTGEYLSRLVTHENERHKPADKIMNGLIYGRRGPLYKDPKTPFTDKTLMGILPAVEEITE